VDFFHPFTHLPLYPLTSFASAFSALSAVRNPGQPPELWLSYEISQQVNLEIIKRFDAEAIQFAFPTQTLFIEKK